MLFERSIVEVVTGSRQDHLLGPDPGDDAGNVRKDDEHRRTGGVMGHD
ncbi:hypothetical protein [Kitasatospora paranensis]